MTRRLGQVTRFPRGARLHPRRNMGGPRRARQAPRRTWRRGATAIAVAASAAVLAGLPAADALNGLAKPHEGCRVLWVIDGDTVKAVCPGPGYVSARITGFDTPELRGSCLAETARAFAATQALRWQFYRAGHIRLWPRGEDRYGRQLVAGSVDGEGLAQRMIGTGLARAYDGGRRAGWCG